MQVRHGTRVVSGFVLRLARGPQFLDLRHIGGTDRRIFGERGIDRFHVFRTRGGERRQANSRRADGAEINRETIASDRDADLLCSLSDFEQALQRLPAEQREVLLLVGLEQMSYREVARVTGTPVGTVMSRLSRARETLARALDGETNPKPIKRVK